MRALVALSILTVSSALLASLGACSGKTSAQDDGGAAAPSPAPAETSSPPSGTETPETRDASAPEEPDPTTSNGSGGVVGGDAGTRKPRGDAGADAGDGEAGAGNDVACWDDGILLPPGDYSDPSKAFRLPDVTDAKGTTVRSVCGLVTPSAKVYVKFRLATTTRRFGWKSESTKPIEIRGAVGGDALGSANSLRFSTTEDYVFEVGAGAAADFGLLVEEHDTP